MESDLLYYLVSALAPMFCFYVLCLFLGDLKGRAREGVISFGSGVLKLIYVSSFFIGVLTYSYINDDRELDTGDSVSFGLIVVFFGAVLIYMMIEYLTVKGVYTDDGIDFYTLWTGRKTERWDDITSVTVDSNWYAITFKSGKVVRLSHYVSNVEEVVELIKARGHEII